MAQLAGGKTVRCGFTPRPIPTEAVGFFANRNHFAGMLAMSLPLTLAGTAWVVTERLAGRRQSALMAVAGCVLVILIILGIALSRSRAGMLLGMIGSAGVAADRHGPASATGYQTNPGPDARRCGDDFDPIFPARNPAASGSDPLNDGRWEYAKSPWKPRQPTPRSGPGWARSSMRSTVRGQARSRSIIINHAHDDYLELWLEGGVPA